MDGQEYLNQISAKNRPTKKSVSGIFKSKFFIIGAAGIGALIIILLFGVILGSGKKSEKVLGYELEMHIYNTASVINTYQINVKSSILRASSASLHSILTNTDTELSNYLSEKYALKNKDIQKLLGKNNIEAASATMEELSMELFEAKINGILDRIYAHKMAYEISVLIAEENKLIEMTRDETLKNLLIKSTQSLSNLFPSFNDFSETK